jgi:hypothetical protein
MRSAALADREQQRHGGLCGLVAAWFLARSERRHAARTSDEVLVLYRSLCTEHPDLAAREILRRVVMTRNGCDATAANVTLECAQESFAQWPTPRVLTLCDVVHYLSVTEFLAAHEDESWIHSNMAQVVAAHVPPELCIASLEA